MDEATENLIRQAEAEGYKRETCARCGRVFEAHIHLIRCAWAHDGCPMVTPGGKTLLEMMMALEGGEPSKA